MKDNNQFDVIIIGGSYSGLSAAMALGRSLRQVLVIDSGTPCNRYTPHSHNFITQDGEQPAAISHKAQKQVAAYDTVRFHSGEVVAAVRNEVGFDVYVASGEQFSSKKILFATGIKDIFPEIKGFAECWGKSVIHCPYCHGYEFRGKKTAIIATGEKAMHIASLVNNLTDSLSINLSDGSEFDRGQLDTLKKHNINVIPKEVIEIKHRDGAVHAVVFNDGREESFDAVYAAIPFTQQSDIPVVLGCEITESGLVKIDTFQKTTVSGVYACGDNSSPMRSVAFAVAAGNMAGAMLNHELTVETF
ncbi:NAD(P)/FAD-dependent oxidoreductase [Sphingobacterium paucimobilis]|uniref:FAD/NAD(P)-binding domain-containing protein n=1 Tax=Sphingobacterium paucimobilis HER1398 TaxID=1346330 RepID=U2HBG5_9SPHI|nr:NAD(P)/FAD-dependent oxidoreductase [Sphingobacterium paucimobilis]ERJ59066.1 hypothetical protein M472_09810 [Sphingobacterium paucimobilis HER1398]